MLDTRKVIERLTEAWGGKVTVVVHYVPESEDFEGGCEAVTMMGVPAQLKGSRLK